MTRKPEEGGSRTSGMSDLEQQHDLYQLYPVSILSEYSYLGLVPSTFSIPSSLPMCWIQSPVGRKRQTNSYPRFSTQIWCWGEARKRRSQYCHKTVCNIPQPLEIPESQSRVDIWPEISVDYPTPGFTTSESRKEMPYYVTVSLYSSYCLRIPLTCSISLFFHLRAYAVGLRRGARRR